MNKQYIKFLGISTEGVLLLYVPIKTKFSTLMAMDYIEEAR